MDSRLSITDIFVHPQLKPLKQKLKRKDSKILTLIKSNNKIKHISRAEFHAVKINVKKSFFKDYVFTVLFNINKQTCGLVPKLFLSYMEVKILFLFC